MPSQERPVNDHSIEAEQELLGAILVNNEAMRYAAPYVEAEHFYEPVHGQIFDLCSSLISLGKLANPVTIQRFMPKDMAVGEGVTLKQYVARLAAAATTIINTSDYAQEVRNYADFRRGRDVLDKYLANQRPDPVEGISATIAELDSIIAGRVSHTSNTATMGHAITAAVDRAALMYQRDGRPSGVPTGLRDLDAKLLGLQPGNLIILAGRPGSGKSALILSILRNLLQMQRETVVPGETELRYRCMLASLEMTETEIGQRMLADEMFDTKRITYHKMRAGSFSEQEFTVMRDAALRLHELPLTIEQQANMTFGQIASKARQLKRTKGLDLLAVDHLHLMKVSGTYRNMAIEIGEITRGFKALAKELAIPVVLLCQLSRGVEGREDKRPTMSDLRMSGDIEQDADVIIMMYREVYYLQNREPKPGTPEHAIWQTKMEATWLKAHALIEKQRMGPLGPVELYCDIGCNAMRDMDYDDRRRSAVVNGVQTELEWR